MVFYPQNDLAISGIIDTPITVHTNNHDIIHLTRIFHRWQRCPDNSFDRIDSF